MFLGIEELCGPGGTHLLFDVRKCCLNVNAKHMHYLLPE